MPRLWKTEPDPSEEDGLGSPDGDAARNASSKAGGEAALQIIKQAKRTRGQAEEAEGKAVPVGDDKSDKKVLLEETPTFDTYEARRRARFLMGGLAAACFFLLGWIVLPHLLV